MCSRTVLGSVQKHKICKFSNNFFICKMGLLIFNSQGYGRSQMKKKTHTQHAHRKYLAYNSYSISKYKLPSIPKKC